MSRKSLLFVGGASTGLVGSSAMAQATASPIEFPVDLASLTSEIATAGALILVTVFSVAIGFAMVKKLKGRLTSSV